ncbi:hypothetical protein HK097_000757, partial [Rhizophlyctis rosea]
MDTYFKAKSSITRSPLTNSPTPSWSGRKAYTTTTIAYDLPTLDHRERCEKLEDLLIAKDSEIATLKRQLAESKYSAAWEKSRQGSEGSLRGRANSDDRPTKISESTQNPKPCPLSALSSPPNPPMKTPTPAARRPTTTSQPAPPSSSSDPKENTSPPTKQTARAIINKLKQHIRDLRKQLQESHNAARADADAYEKQIAVLRELVEEKEGRLRGFENGVRNGEKGPKLAVTIKK